MMKSIQNGRYEILEVIGSGGMSKVYLGMDKIKNEQVAIKQLSLASEKNRTESIIRFKREAKIISRLSHKNVVKVFDIIEEENDIYLIMEYFKGKNLYDIKQDFTLQEKISIIKEIADTLAYIHNEEVIHRDLKPGNILVQEIPGDGEERKILVKIIDFGLAYLVDLKDLYKEGVLYGSFAYISPEQTGLLRRIVDNRSDLYSLGATFYELLTNQVPFKNKDIGKLIHMHLATTPQKPSNFNSQVPDVIDNIVLKLLKKEPEERYQTSEGLARDLGFYLTSYKGKTFSIGENDSKQNVDYHVKMVGRQEELNLIRNCYAQVKAGFSQILLVIGASGSGKTKLLESFKEDVYKDNTRFLFCKCSKAMQNNPFAPFNEIVKNFFEEMDTNSSIQAIKKVQKKLQDDFAIIYTIFPAIKDHFKYLYQYDEAYDVEHINKEAIFENIIAFFKILNTKDETFILFLDDMQWADDNSIDFIDYFSGNVENEKIMFSLTVRKEDWEKRLKEHLNPEGALISFVELHGMNNEVISNFIKSILNKEDLFDNFFYRKVFDCTMGNPFKILEMVKALVDKEILFFKNKQWNLNSAKFEYFEFDQDVSKILLNRLSLFKEHEKEVLSIASIIGKEFTVDLLHSLISDKSIEEDTEVFEKVISVIDHAKEEQLIVEELLLGKGYYVFANEKISETLHNDLDEVSKKVLHLRYARKLENIYRDHIEDEIYQIAYHYNFTSDNDKIIYYNHLSYQKALTQYAVSDAIFYLQKVVDINLEFKQTDKQLVYLITLMGHYMQVAGKITESFDYLSRALEIAEKESWEEEEININLEIGTGCYYLNDINKSLEYYNKAMELSEKRGEEVKIGYPYYLIGSNYWFVSELKLAEENLTKAILYMDEEDWNNKLPAYAMRSATYIMMGKITETFQDVEMMEKSFIKTNNTVILPHAYHCCALAYAWGEKDFEKAMEYSLKAYELSKESNNIIFQYSSLFSRSLIYFYQKKYDKALQTIDKTLEVAKKNKIYVGIYLVHGYKSESFLWKKDFNSANKIALSFLPQKDDIVEKLPILLFLKARAIYLYFHGIIDEALRVLEEAEVLFLKTNITLIGISILVIKAYILKKTDNKKELERVEAELVLFLKRNPDLNFLVKQTTDLIEMIEEEITFKKTTETFSNSTSILKEKLQLENIINTSQIISSILDIDLLLNTVLEKTLEVTGAERGALLLYDRNMHQLEYKVIKDIDVNAVDFEISKSIIDKVSKTKKGVVITNVDSDFDMTKSIIAQNIKSIICAPLLVKDKFIGLLYLDSKLLNNLFSQEDLQLLSVFTSQAAISIENARLYENLEKNKRGLEQIIKASANLFELQSFKQFLSSILPQLGSILAINGNTFYLESSALLLQKKEGHYFIMDATGDYEDIEAQTIDANKLGINDELQEANETNSSNYFKENSFVGTFKVQNFSEYKLFLKTRYKLSELDKDLIRIFSTNISIAFDNLFLNKDIVDTQKEVILTLGEVIAIRSNETGFHVRRVTDYACYLAELAGLDDTDIELLRLAAPMHDVGKIGVKDSILHKPIKLTDYESEIMREHTNIGYNLLRKSNRKIMKTAATIAKQHHERWDGTGYPNGLKGEEIHIFCRIITLVDIFDALSQKRVYKEAWPIGQVIEWIKNERGKHFEPKLLDLFLDHLEGFLRIKETYPEH